MVTIPWADIEAGAMASQPQVVQSSYNAAKQFACGLYNGYQGFFGNQAPQGPLDGLKRGVWDKICGPGLPPVPSSPPPWDGETCACKEYRVTVKARSQSQVVVESVTDLTGPIFGLVNRFPNEGLTTWAVRHGICSGGAFTGAALRDAITTAQTDTVYIESSVLLSSGGGCLVPSPTPVPPPVPPPPERQRIQQPITIAPGITINAPIVLVKPTLNNNIDVGVEIAVGGINFNFSLGGVEFNLNPTFAPVLVAPTVNLPPLPPGTPRPPALPPAGGGSADCPDVDLQPVLDAIRNERKYYGTRNTTLIESVVGSGRGGNVALPTRTENVRVRITTDPLSVKEQAGSGAPDVLYAGWCSSGRDRPGIRNPINYRDTTFPVGENENRFTWTLYNGGNAEITAIHRVNLPGCVENECG